MSAMTGRWRSYVYLTCSAVLLDIKILVHESEITGRGNNEAGVGVGGGLVIPIKIGSRGMRESGRKETEGWCWKQVGTRDP